MLAARPERVVGSARTYGKSYAIESERTGITGDSGLSSDDLRAWGSVRFTTMKSDRGRPGNESGSSARKGWGVRVPLRHHRSFA
jgi:hypothetical protein